MAEGRIVRAAFPDFISYFSHTNAKILPLLMPLQILQ